MRNKRPPRGKFVPRLATIVALGLCVAPVARAQVAAVAPPVAAPAPAEAAPPAAAQPAPPAEPAPGYGYGPPAPGYGGYGYGPPAPAPYYYYHHRYRPMPYYPYAQYSPYAYPYAAAATMVEPMAGFHTHDGFYLRVHAGISGTGFQSTTNGVKTNYVGDGGSSGIAIGGVICHNLVLYGAIFGTDTTNPDKQVGGSSVTADLGGISVAAVGPGIAYYFDHFNLYVSGSFGLAGFSARDGNGFKVDSSRSGSALDLMVGKEWWVSRDWGMGIAGELFGASLKDKNTPGLTWSANAVSLLFSATYN